MQFRSYCHCYQIALLAAFIATISKYSASVEAYQYIEASQFGSQVGARQSRWVPGEVVNGYVPVKSPGYRPKPFLVYTPERNMFTRTTTTVKPVWPVWNVLGQAAAKADAVRNPSISAGDLAVQRVPGLTQFYPRNNGVSPDGQAPVDEKYSGYYVRHNPLNSGAHRYRSSQQNRPRGTVLNANNHPALFLF